jgi:hypothetical protein
MSVSEPDIDSDDPTRVLVRQVIGATRSVRTRRDPWAHDGGQGSEGRSWRLPWRPSALRLRAEGKELVPDEREQAVIALARKLTGEGLSSRQVATCLEEAGHRPEVGERWSSVQVCRILRERSFHNGPTRPWRDDGGITEA